MKQQEQPLISVIIPMYNVERYIDRCLQSVVNQTYKNLEIIIVNDGSKDSSYEIAMRYASSDTRIKVLQKVNGGLSSARNFGLDVASGDYIAFVDSDDFIELDMYECLINGIIDSNADICLCGYFKYDEIKESISRVTDIQTKVYKKEEALSMLLKNTSIESHVWDRIYKKELFDDIRFPLGLNYEDVYVMHKLFMKTSIIAHINNPKYYYVNRIDSITNDKSYKNTKNLFLSFITRYNDIDDICNYNDHISQLNNIASLYIYYCQFSGQKKNLRFVKEFLNVQNKKYNFLNVISNKKQLQWKLNSVGINYRIQYSLFNIARKFRLKTRLHLNKDTSVSFSKSEENIFLLGTPEYDNVGDHAIAYSSIKFLKDTFPNKNIISITESQIINNWKEITKLILPSNLIFLQGGGNIGDIYVEQEYIRNMIIKSLRKNKIVIMPSTIYFKDKSKSKQIMNKYYLNKNLYIFAREKNTYKFLEDIEFNNRLLTPDIALYLKNDYKSSIFDRKEQVGICLRADVESSLSFDNRLKIKKLVFGSSNMIKTFDTCTHSKIEESIREATLKSYLDLFSGLSLVVTDRLHAMIFSYITDTPCIVLDNFNGKIKGVHEWINNSNFIRFIDDIDMIPNLVNELVGKSFIEQNQCAKDFDKLKEFLRNL